MVHFSWYFRYMEEAEHALWRSLGMTIASRDDDYRFPRVSANCDFKRSIWFEDEIEVVIRIATVGNRTVRYTCSILRGGVSVAEGSMTSACIRVGPGAPTGAVEIPPRILAKLMG